MSIPYYLFLIPNCLSKFWEGDSTIQSYKLTKTMTNIIMNLAPACFNTSRTCTVYPGIILRRPQNTSIPLAYQKNDIIGIFLLF